MKIGTKLYKHKEGGIFNEYVVVGVITGARKGYVLECQSCLHETKCLVSVRQNADNSFRFHESLNDDELGFYSRDLCRHHTSCVEDMYFTSINKAKRTYLKYLINKEYEIVNASKDLIKKYKDELKLYED